MYFRSVRTYSCNNNGDNDALAQHAEEFADSMAESQVIDGFQYFKIFDDQRLEYILLATGMSENAYTVGKLAVMQIQNLLTAYKERLDKENFVKNLLRDNLLLVDIYNRSKKLHIEVEQRRVAFLIQAEYEKDQNLLEATKELKAEQIQILLRQWTRRVSFM